ncbi:hypothetical protein WJX74_008176 [Apatococcus lobatus]|uniref:Protein kinase domain-containing protein n=1 Tax=Apatococcus lobatus TaxID=904363 RepID=A0AAW1RAG1_9CHLO
MFTPLRARTGILWSWSLTAVLCLIYLYTATARVTIVSDSLIETGTNYAGNGLNDTIAPSAEACSQLCRDSYNNSCNIFVFCGVIQGCTAGATGPYPFGTCSLKFQDGVWPVEGNQPLVYDIDRNDDRIAWTSGAPMWFNAPDLFDGWQAVRGVDLLGHFDYICPLTNKGRLPNILECEYEGTAQEVAGYCEQDPNCRAFSYFSNASTLPDNSPHSPAFRPSYGILKGGHGFNLDVAFSIGNPSSVVYWKPGLHEPGIESNPGIMAGIVIAAVVFAAAVAPGIWLLVRRRQGTTAMKATASFINPRVHATVSGQSLLRETGMTTQGSGEQELIPTLAEASAIQMSTSIVRHRTSVDIDAAGMGFLQSHAPPQEADVVLEEAADTFQDFPLPAAAGWQIAPEQISICRRTDGKDWKAGEGGFGQVYKALQDGVTAVAVKRLHNSLDARQRQLFLREIATLRDLHSPHIVQFLGACLQPGHTMLVTEWMDESLWDAMARNRSHGLPTDTLGWYARGQEIALDVAKGLHHLHSRGIIHLDLKSSNILLRQGVAKIADVGFAKILSQSAHSQLVGGTWAWAAPEVLLGKQSTTQADIYSFGVVIWELVTGEQPIRGNSRDVFVPAECPTEIHLLLDECFDSDPKKRPTARNIVHRLEANMHVEAGLAS